MFGYFELVKNFEYLTNEYGMDLIESRLRSSFPYAVWSNGKINIKVICDFSDIKPLHLYVYKADDLAMFEVLKEYIDEFIYQPKSNTDVVGYFKYAARVFYDILKKDKTILNQ